MSRAKLVRNTASHERSGSLRPLNQWSDEELMVQYCRNFRRDVFTELVRRYQRELYSYLRRYLGDAQSAEDVFQATFLQVHLKCRQYEPQRPFRPWLYALATHLAIDYQRRTSRHHYVSLDRNAQEAVGDKASSLAQVLQSPHPSPVSEVVRREDAHAVRCAVDSLSEPMRQVIQLVYFQGLKYREAAEALSVPVGTVKSRIHAAMERLAEWLRLRHRAVPRNVDSEVLTARNSARTVLPLSHLADTDASGQPNG